MSDITLLEEKVAELEQVVNDEQEQVAALLAQKNATIVGLEETVTSLEQLVAEGGSTEQRQALLDRLNTILADVKSTVEPTE